MGFIPRSDRLLGLDAPCTQNNYTKAMGFSPLLLSLSSALFSLKHVLTSWTNKDLFCQ